MEIKTTLTYVANNGTEFDNEEECRAYECANALDGLYAYDEKLHSVLSADQFDEARFVNVTDERQASMTFTRINYYYGYPCPPAVEGKYYWDNRQCWMNINTINPNLITFYMGDE